MNRTIAFCGALCAVSLLAAPLVASGQVPAPSPSPMGTMSPEPMPSPTSTGIFSRLRRLELASSITAGNGMSDPMLETSDSMFVMNAAQGGITEVKAAKIALTKTDDPKVRAFANEMIADHVKNNEQFVSLVKSEGMTVPTSVGATHEAELAKLQALPARSFDAEYLAGQIAAHKQMLALMQAEAATGKDAKFAQFAKNTAPVVEHHLSLAETDAHSNT